MTVVALTYATDVDCGAVPEIENGNLVLVNGRTTYNASAEYSCAENYTLVGASKRVCTQQALWSPEEPKCLCKLFILTCVVPSVSKFQSICNWVMIVIDDICWIEFGWAELVWLTLFKLLVK